MSNNIQPELEGWDRLEGIAGIDNIPTQNKIKIETSRKTILAMSNLGNSILSMQKIIGARLDKLNEVLEKSNQSSEIHSKRMFWLTLALFAASAMQAIAVIVSVLQ